MRRSRLRRRRSIAGADMNITAFMNLMVILVPFLLITAVFSRMTILELNLPTAASATPDNKETMQLQITVRADALELGERQRGLMRRFPKTGKGQDFAGLSQTLRKVKESYPGMTNATILLEADTPYDLLVQTMDTVRMFEVVSAGKVDRFELFPDISIGDAPAAGGSDKR